MKTNNISIPQKIYDATANEFKDAASITSPGSAYTISSGSGGYMDYTSFSYDKDYNLTNESYKIDFSNKHGKDFNKNIGTSKNVTWNIVSGEGERTVAVPFSSDVTKYIQYNYKIPANYTNSNRVIELTSSISNAIFNGLSATDLNIFENSSGGAIFNSKGSDNFDINAFFVNNYVSRFGGAIYNAETGKIGNINVDFINNHIKNAEKAASGAAIYNEGSIKNIAGDFIGNGTLTSGSGAINNNK